MTNTASYRAFAALLTPEDGPGEFHVAGTLPTLNERVELFLRAVHRSDREFSADERAVARTRILDAMADNLGDQIKQLGRPEEPVAAVPNVPSDLATAQPLRQLKALRERVTGILESFFFPLVLATGPRARYVTACLAVFLLAAGSWVGAWFYSARTAEFTIAQWIDREARAGRIYECGSRSIGGFPLRVEIRCIEPSMKIAFDQITVTADAKEIRAVASVLQPEDVNIEIRGPISVAESNQPTFLANWTSAHLRLHGKPTAPEDISISFDAVQFYRVAQTGMRPLLTSDRIEAKIRPLTNARFEILGHVTGGFTPLVGPLALQPFLADVAADINGTVDGTPRNFGTLVREWQANGGRIELKSARVQQDNALADAQGDLWLNANGLFDGSMRVKTTGVYVQFAESLMRADQNGADRARIAQSFELSPQTQTRSIGEPATNEPARNTLLVPPAAPPTQSGISSEMAIRIHDGKVYLGTVIVAEIPALYVATSNSGPERR